MVSIQNDAFATHGAFGFDKSKLLDCAYVLYFVARKGVFEGAYAYWE